MVLQLQLTCLLLVTLCWSRAASRMALETQEDYLNHIYAQVKDRPLRNGELNLLPDHDESLPGFANTVRCIPEEEEGATDMTDKSRKMHFQRVTLKPSENLISLKLVISLPAGFSENGEVKLYETSDGSDEHKQLDTASVPSCNSTCWFELNVGAENMLDDMELLLEFTHRNREFVRHLNPMLALYTYMMQPLPDFLTQRHNPNTKRAVEEPVVNTLLTELDSRGVACSKQTVRLNYSQMNWLGDEAVTILRPSPYINFDFCYGQCNSPLAFLPHNEPTESYDKRARILEVINQLNESRRLTPQPCCVPLSYTSNDILYDEGGRIATTSLDSVEECGCRA